MGARADRKKRASEKKTAVKKPAKAKVEKVLEQEVAKVYNTLEEKYQAALNQIGGRLKLTAIMTRRLRELKLSGMKQKGSFNVILDSLLEEILDGTLTLEEPKKSKK